MSHRLLSILVWLECVACVGAALLVGGCGTFDRPYPDKAMFAIALGTPPSDGRAGGLGARPPAAGHASVQPIAPILRVKGMRVAKPFDTTSFVYKVGESKFTTDYYNGFVAEPDRLLTGELLDWLAASGEFGSVVEEGSTADYRLTLESSVTELYGDYTNRSSPRAVMELKVFVIDEEPSASKVIFQKTYRQTETLPDNTPEKLVRGWEAAYRRILTRLLSDLRASPQVVNAGLGSRPQ